MPDPTVKQQDGNLGRARAALAQPMVIALVVLGLIMGVVYLLMR